MKILIEALFLICFVSIFALANEPAKESSSCSIHKSDEVYFTSLQTKDEIKVSIINPDCKDSIFLLKILDTSGKLVYKFEKDLSEIYFIHPNDWKKDHIKTMMNNWVARIIKKSNNRYSTDFPPLMNREDFYNTYNYGVAEGKEDLYKTVTKKRRPVIYHPTYSEGGHFIYYDKELNQAVVFLYWGY